MTNESKSDLLLTNREIVLNDQWQSHLDCIEKSLSEKIKAAKTPEEAQKYLNLIEQRQTQIERKKYADLQREEIKNQIIYERKVKIYQEIISITFTLISFVTGLSLIKVMPSVASLLIVLAVIAVIKPLGYSMNKAVTLLNSLAEFAQTSKFPNLLITQEKSTDVNQLDS
jgi:hypothetical protein